MSMRRSIHGSGARASAGPNLAIHLAVGIALLLLGGMTPAVAEEKPSEDAGEVESQAPAGPADEYGRGVPRTAMHGYLLASRQGDFQRAAEYLDLRRIPEAKRARLGPQLARQLKVVLDQRLWVEIDALSDRPDGQSGDALPWYRDRVGVVETVQGPVDVFLDRVPRGDDVRIWKVSGATVARIPQLFDEFGYGPLEQYLPQVLFDFHLLELALWQWVAILLLLVSAGIAGWAAAALALSSVRPLVRRSRTDFDDRLLDATLGPLRLAIGLAFFHLGILGVGLPVPARRILGGAEKALAIFALTWLLFRLMDALGVHLERRLVRRGQAPASHFVPLGRKAVKVLIGAVAFLAALDSFGFDVTALVAGLGVGGIAVALAAQKTIENLFGGVTVIADRPVRPGDFCRFGDNVGTVEEIGLRSTRVRTLDRTVVTIPNAQFSSLQLENFAMRDQIRFQTVLGLRYETTSDQLRHVLVEIRRLLLSHPKVARDPARVRFAGFGAYSLDLEIFAYVQTWDWNEFLAIREDLLLRLMDIVASSGSAFAFPSQTNYVARDDGLDVEKLREAEVQVRAWREKGELPLPDFSPEAKTALKTLAYPAEGSALSRIG
jgi:MscS family membrane protein